MGRRWPDHCCCCGLRPGGYVIGGIAIAICLPLTVLVGMHSSKLRPKHEDDVRDCFYMVVYLYKLSAALNAIEVLFTLGLFWGIYKKKEKWVTRWLFVSTGWWTHHSIFSMALLFSASHYIPLLCAAFLGPFIYFMGYRAMKTVAGLRDTMVKEEDDVENQLFPYPAGDSAAAAGVDTEGNPIANADADAGAATNVDAHGSANPNPKASASAADDDNVQL